MHAHRNIITNRWTWTKLRTWLPSTKSNPCPHSCSSRTARWWLASRGLVWRSSLRPSSCTHRLQRTCSRIVAASVTHDECSSGCSSRRDMEINRHCNNADVCLLRYERSLSISYFVMNYDTSIVLTLVRLCQQAECEQLSTLHYSNPKLPREQCWGSEGEKKYARLVRVLTY